MYAEKHNDCSNVQYRRRRILEKPPKLGHSNLCIFSSGTLLLTYCECVFCNVWMFIAIYWEKNSSNVTKWLNSTKISHGFKLLRFISLYLFITAMNVLHRCEISFNLLLLFNYANTVDLFEFNVNTTKYIPHKKY